MSLAIVHDFDRSFGQVFGLPLYWYGAVYSIGLSGVLLWFLLRRRRIGWNPDDVLDFTIIVALGLLVGGRAFDILVYEMDYYQRHPHQIFDWWQGGMASHGVLLGGIVAAALVCRLKRTPLLPILDEFSLPAAFLLAAGRLGNFIEGGVVGTETTMPWGVVYPDLEGSRHPVALYESAKNLAMVPLLTLALRRWPPGTGVAAALFVLLYGGLRFAVDMFRDYESTWFGIGTGQIPNLAMALLGAALLVRFLHHPRRAYQPEISPSQPVGWLRVAGLIFLLAYPLGIPTSWTASNIDEKRRATQATNQEPALEPLSNPEARE